MFTLHTHIKKVFLVFILIIALIIFSHEISAQETTADSVTNGLVDAISNGKLDFGLRLRYEQVDDDAATENADALTNRTILGYRTGEFNNFSVRLLLQDVREIVDNYNDGTGRDATRNRYAVVADPSETDFLEAYAAYTGISDTTFKFGRQIITYRGAPFHRHMGTVLWRQNWQNHDAVSLENKSLPDTTIRYAYSWNVNRIFTDEAVASARANFESDSHFINVQYTGLGVGTLEGYAYLLDFDNAAANSTATYGARLSGSHSAAENVNILYAAEYAMQDDYANNTASVDEDYFLGEIGANFKFDSAIESLTLKFDYELLSGNGSTRFRTPLATGHAFQGWADRFLTTPADGIEDIYFTAVAKAFGVNFLVAYHDLSSDHDSYDYGTEIDVQGTYPINKHFTLGLKYAGYDADSNATNLSRNGNIATDVSKFWAWLQFTY